MSLFHTMPRAFAIQYNTHDSLPTMHQAHYHDNYELYYQVAGDRYVFARDAFCYVRQGGLVWLNKLELHQSFQGDQSQGARIVVNFTEAFLSDALREEKAAFLALVQGPFFQLSLDEKQQGTALCLFKQIQWAYREGETLYAKLALGQLLVLVRRWIRQSGGVQPANGPVDPKIERIAMTVAYLKAHFTQKITLEAVARQFYVTPSYLSRSFKRHVGISFVQYVNHLRVEYAGTLLRSQPQMSITQAASAAGFESAAHFQRVFKQLTGMTAQQWRRQSLL